MSDPVDYPIVPHEVIEGIDCDRCIVVEERSAASRSFDARVADIVGKQRGVKRTVSG